MTKINANVADMQEPDMPEDIMVDQVKFDALLRRIALSKPVSHNELKAVPKLKKDGQPKQGKH